MYVSRQLYLPTQILLHQLTHILSIIAQPWVDFKMAFSYWNIPCIFQPLQMQTPEQLSWSCRWIISLSIFDRSKLVFPDGLKETEFFSFLENIEIEKLKFDTIIQIWLFTFFCVFVVTFDFLFCQMIFPVDFFNYFGICCDFLDKFCWHENCGSVSMTIDQLSIFLQLHYILWNFTIFANLNFSIHINMNTNFFLCIRFFNISWDNFEIVLDHISNTCWIA